MVNVKPLKIIFLNHLDGYWKEKFASLKFGFPQAEITEITDPETRAAELKTADAAVTGRLSEEEITGAENLKVIFVPFTGTNNFPAEIIRKRKIIISNTHANAAYVAERAVSLALALLGRVTEFHDDLKLGKWSRTHEADDLWISMRGKRAAIIGYGHIGSYIAKYLKPYDCKITGYKRNIKSVIDINPDVLLSDDLKFTIENNDVIFVTLPASDETKGLINSEILLNMKGKFIINVGRGATIDEEALYKSLKDGILAGAALDVWYKYPKKGEETVLPANFPFWELPNVVFSPHKASHTLQAVKAMIDDTAENIRSFIITGKPKETVIL